MVNSLRQAAVIVLACVLGACGIVFVAVASGPWHPPGESEAPTFDCKPWVETLWRCEAKHVSVRFPQQWPKWESYVRDGQRGDCDRGAVAFLDLWPRQSHLILMKPSVDPSTWVRKYFPEEK